MPQFLAPLLHEEVVLEDLVGRRSTGPRDPEKLRVGEDVGAIVTNTEMEYHPSMPRRAGGVFLYFPPLAERDPIARS
jgi:hypothetical protein